MSTVAQNITAIREATYGWQVREAIADSIDQCYTNVSSGVTLAETAAGEALNSAAEADRAADSAGLAAEAANTAASAANSAAEAVSSSVSSAVLAESATEEQTKAYLGIN